MAENIELIVLSFITAFAILGFRKAMEPGHIAQQLGYLADDINIGDKIWLKCLISPLFGCEYCMSSVWTISVHLIFTDFNLAHAIFGILVTCGIIVTLRHESN